MALVDQAKSKRLELARAHILAENGRDLDRIADSFGEDHPAAEAGALTALVIQIMRTIRCATRRMV